MNRVFLLALGLALLGSIPAQAQSWAQKMFKVTSHDFGTVAKGAKTEFRFELQNIYVEDVHLLSIRSSCGCTTPRIETDTLKTWEKGAVVAHVNTDTFTGQRGATLTVTIDRPYRAEVQLQVSVNIQPDVVLTPGSIAFGNVAEGQAFTQQAQIQVPAYRNYRIEGVRSASDYLTAEVLPARGASGRAAYQLRVRLSEKAPPGMLREHLMLVATDGRRREIPVLVEGFVKPAAESVVVSPQSLFLGVVHPGETVRKQVVVRSDKPFRITSIKAENGKLQAVPPDGDVPKALHLVPITFVAGDDAGRVDEVIHIETDLDNSRTALAATAVVTK